MHNSSFERHILYIIFSDDWWKGKVNGLEGLVPHIYVNLTDAKRY